MGLIRLDFNMPSAWYSGFTTLIYTFAIVILINFYNRVPGTQCQALAGLWFPTIVVLSEQLCCIVALPVERWLAKEVLQLATVDLPFVHHS